MRETKVSPQERETNGDEWARKAEMNMRERAVLDDPALAVELGARALANLASEFSTPIIEVGLRARGHGDYAEAWYEHTTMA